MQQGYSRFLTVYKAKGLKSDIVIFLNCNSGKYAFPSGMSDDTVLNPLLSEADKFENGEEKYLFYVAMTKAKEKGFFFTDFFLESKFISEVDLDVGEPKTVKYPSCKSADLVLRKTGTTKYGKNFNFYGCSNFQFGCTYTKTEYH